MWIFLTAGQLSSRVLTLSANTTQELFVYDNNENRPEEWIRFLTVGLHSQKHNLTLFKGSLRNDSSISGHNIGLVLITSKDTGLIFIQNKHHFDVNALLTTTEHGDNGKTKF